MIPNAIQYMHAWLPRIANKIEWTIPVTYWWCFILDVFLFCLQLFTDHDACSKEPGTFRIVKKDVEERCYLVEVRSSSQMFLLLFCHVLPFQSSWSIEATIWWRLKWRFVADPFLNRHVLDSMLNYVIWRCTLCCHVWPWEPTVVPHNPLDFSEPVFCLGNPAWHELNAATQVVPWNQRGTSVRHMYC